MQTPTVVFLQPEIFKILTVKSKLNRFDIQVSRVVFKINLEFSDIEELESIHSTDLKKLGLTFKYVIPVEVFVLRNQRLTTDQTLSSQ